MILTTHRRYCPRRRSRIRQRVTVSVSLSAGNVDATGKRRASLAEALVVRSSCGMSIVQVEKSKMNSGLVGRLNPKPKLLDQAAHFDVLPEQVGLH